MLHRPDEHSHERHGVSDAQATEGERPAKSGAAGASRVQGFDQNTCERRGASSGVRAERTEPVGVQGAPMI